MHTSHGKAISFHSIPSSISSFAEKKGRHESIHESFSAIQTTSTELEIADIVLKIQRENRLNIFSRLIDRFFNDSRKQHARDHMVTLAIADVYKEYINHLPGALSPAQQQDIKDKFSHAVGKAISRMDYMQGHHFSTVEECASYALHCLLKGTNAGCSSEFAGLWTLTNVNIGYAGDDKNRVQMTAAVRLSERDGGPLSFDISVDDVSCNDFVLSYMAQNANSHLEEKRSRYKTAVEAFDEADKLYKDSCKIFNNAMVVVDTFRAEATQRSIEIAEKVANCLSDNADLSLIEETEAQIAACLHDASVLKLKEEGATSLRTERSDRYATLVITAKEMLSCSKDYNDAAQGFHRIGQFIEASSTVSVSEKWQQKLNNITNGESLDRLALINQRPAFKTILFQTLSVDLKKYVEDEYAKHKTQRTPEAVEAAEAVEAVEAVGQVQSLLSDQRGSFSNYINTLSDTFLMWKASNNSYETHDSQLSDLEDNLEKGLGTSDYLLRIHKEMIDCFADDQLRIPPDPIAEKIKRDRVTNFVDRMKKPDYQQSMNEVVKMEDTLTNLSNVHTNTITELNKSRENLQNSARPYSYPTRIMMGDEYTEEANARDRRFELAALNLQHITSLRPDENRMTLLWEQLGQFKSDVTRIRENFRDVVGPVENEQSIDNYLQRKQQESEEKLKESLAGISKARDVVL